MGILRADRITGLGGANAIKGSVFFGTFGTATYGNQIEIQKDAELDIGNGNLTVECWFNSPHISGYQSILGQEYYNNFTSFVQIFIKFDRKLRQKLGLQCIHFIGESIHILPLIL